MKNPRLIMRLFTVASGLLVFIHSARSPWLNPDGVRYLDMGEALFRGDWDMFINPVWSPLYSALLGAVMTVFEPRLEMEIVAVQAVNFVIFLCALGTFEFFWYQLRQDLPGRGNGDVSGGWLILDPWSWAVLGYGLFMFGTFRMTKMWFATPDLTVAAIVLLAAGLILRARRRGPTVSAILTIGLVLGVAYLGKAVMFPVGLFLLAALALPGARPGLRPRWALLGLVGFMAVAAPWILAISMSRGRVTTGDAAKITYAKFVNDIPHPHWQGGPPELGRPLHPTRQLSERPEVFEYQGPIGGTYPVEQDIYYWYEGYTPVLSPASQLKTIAKGLYLLHSTLFLRLGGVTFLAGLFLCLGQSARDWRHLRSSLEWGIALPASGAMALYCLVYMEPRYVGVFLILLLASLLAAIRLPAGASYAATLRWGSVMMAISLALSLVPTLARTGLSLFDLDPVPKILDPAKGEGLDHAELARELGRLGLDPGDTIGIIGMPNKALYARLARLRIVAEVPRFRMLEFWALDRKEQDARLDLFESLGVAAVVSDIKPLGEVPEGWQPLGAHKLIWRPGQSRGTQRSGPGAESD